MKSEHSTSSWLAACRSVGVKSFALAVTALTIVGFAPTSAHAGWGTFYVPRARPISVAPPDQTWLLDVPEKPGARKSKVAGKVAVFVFKGDDVYQPVRAAVVRMLRRRGLNVTATLRPVDSAEQYRELSYALNMGIFVQGEIRGEGAHQTALIHLYSGVTGRRVASAKFSGTTPKIVADIGRTFWTRSGATITRACTSASRPRRREREPLHIEAGTPIDSAPTPVQDT